MIYAQAQRLKLINELKMMFIQADKEDKTINKKKLISLIINRYGSTERKALEYIRDLMAADFIDDVAGELALIKSAETETLNDIKENLN